MSVSGSTSRMDARPHALLLAVVVLASSHAGAAAGAELDVAPLLACRRLPPGPTRIDCLERASAELEQAAGARQADPADPAAPPAPSKPRDPAPTTGESRQQPGTIHARLADLTYEAGKPIFRLQDGAVWASRDPRHLTRRPGGDTVEIRRSPVGALLRFNGSFFALPVVRRN